MIASAGHKIDYQNWKQMPEIDTLDALVDAITTILTTNLDKNLDNQS